MADTRVTKTYTVDEQARGPYGQELARVMGEKWVVEQALKNGTIHKEGQRHAATQWLGEINGRIGEYEKKVFGEGPIDKKSEAFKTVRDMASAHADDKGFFNETIKNVRSTTHQRMQTFNEQHPVAGPAVPEGAHHGAMETIKGMSNVKKVGAVLAGGGAVLLAKEAIMPGKDENGEGPGLGERLLKGAAAAGLAFGTYKMVTSSSQLAHAGAMPQAAVPPSAPLGSPVGAGGPKGRGA